MLPMLLKSLGTYALGQVANNLPAILTVGGTVIGGLIDKVPIPSPAKSLLKGAVGGTLLVIAHNGSSPAPPASSAIQKALRPK